MALVVEDGTAVASADSYLSVSDADAYHTSRGNDDWTGADAVKEAALRNATAYLDATYNWVGSIKYTTQVLGWPRNYACDKEGRSLDNIVPVNVKNATAELALASLSASLAPVESKDDFVVREKIGSIEVEYKNGSPSGRRFNYVSRILNGIYTNSVGGTSVKVVRV